MAEKRTHLAEWIGSDGKKYVTDDPITVARRRAHGHDIWTVTPPSHIRFEDDTP